MTIAAMVQTGLRELRLDLRLVPVARHMLITLLLVDIAFIALHVLRAAALKYGWAPFDVTLASSAFAIDTEGGYPEDWQYAKEIATAVLLLLAALRTRQPVYGAWAALFAFAGLDDSVAIHERMGALLEPVLPHIDKLQGHDLGELLFAAAAGFVLLGGIIYGSWRSAPLHVARSWIFVFPLAGLALCGMGFDLVHAIVRYSYPGSNLVLTVLEDGGEMLFMSFACALAVAAFTRAAEPFAPQAQVASGVE
jgi:hypothetical protein